MVFPHHSSGYRTVDARGQGRAFKFAPHPQPVYPVDAAPVRPPSPPPPVFAPAAVGGSAAAFPLLAVAGSLGGLALGLWVKKDIDAFKKKAKQPFYDTDYVYGRPKGGLNPYWDASKEAGFDKEADDLYKDHLYDLLENYEDPHYWFRAYDAPANFYSPDGRHSPTLDNPPNKSYWRYVHTCPANPAATHWVGNSAGNCSGHDGTMNVWATNGTIGTCDPIITGFVNDGIAPPTFWCDPPLTRAQLVGGYSKSVLNRLVAKEAWVLTPWPVSTIPWPGEFDYGFGLIGQSIVLADYDIGFGSPATWANAVAAPGTQPSLEEQLAGSKLPKGKLKRGYYVPMPLNYPLLLVQVTGSAPVTVPDVTIDPGTDTVTIVPPSPPEYPSPEAGGFERKPYNPVRGMAAFVNVATEAQDFLEAMHEGLPKKYRRKGRWGIVPDGDIILADIIAHWDEWDAQVALEAFVNNQIEDYLLGKYYFRYGVGRRGASGAATKEIATYLPQVHFANGQHSISVGDVEIDLVSR